MKSAMRPIPRAADEGLRCPTTLRRVGLTDVAALEAQNDAVRSVSWSRCRSRAVLSGGHGVPHARWTGASWFGDDSRVPGWRPVMMGE
jgi:hypothetical protein